MKMISNIIILYVVSMVTEQMSISRDVALNFHTITDNILFLNDINENRALF